MKIKFFPADDKGCGYYRVFLPAQRAKEVAGVEVEYAKDINARWTKDMKTVVAVEEQEVDVVVFQRPLTHPMVQAIPLIQKQGIAVVVEVDDDFSHLNPKNQVFHTVHPKSNTPYNWLHLKEACRLADQVTVSTPGLVEVYGGVAIPNTLDPVDVRESPATTDQRVVGWTGSVGVHPTDLQVTKGGVEMALQKADASFFVVGNQNGVKKALGLSKEPKETGWLPYADYISAIDKLDVGIVPLDNTRFNQGKSYLKGLEYAARGIPFVASPVREYKTLSERGIGNLAQDKAKEWSRELLTFLEDDFYRENMAHWALEQVREKYTIHSAIDQWVSAWEAAVQNRKDASMKRGDRMISSQ